MVGSDYIATKTASAIGGLLGGFGLMTYIRPRTINEAFTRGAVSTSSAIIFATPILQIMKVPTNWEVQLMAGFAIGFVSYSILGAVANFFAKNEDSDIVEMVHTARGKKKKNESTDRPA